MPFQKRPVMQARPAVPHPDCIILLPNRYLWQEVFAKNPHAKPGRLLPAAPVSLQTLSASPYMVRSSRSLPCSCSSTSSRRRRT